VVSKFLFFQIQLVCRYAKEEAEATKEAELKEAQARRAAREEQRRTAAEAQARSRAQQAKSPAGKK
jgi:hypothetical protein